jgi:hypothetical protein
VNLLGVETDGQDCDGKSSKDWQAETHRHLTLCTSMILFSNWIQGKGKLEKAEYKTSRGSIRGGEATRAFVPNARVWVSDWLR